MKALGGDYLPPSLLCYSSITSSALLEELDEVLACIELVIKRADDLVTGTPIITFAPRAVRIMEGIEIGHGEPLSI